MGKTADWFSSDDDDFGRRYGATRSSKRRDDDDLDFDWFDDVWFDGPTLVLFSNAGSGWLQGQAMGSLNFDVGAGIEIGGLGFDFDKISIFWELPAEPGGLIDTYLVRSLLPNEFTEGAGSVCLAPDSLAQATDTTVPDPGVALYYLAWAENDCPSGIGSLVGLRPCRRP